MIRRSSKERRKGRAKDVRIERLEEVLLEIALIADGHKSSRLYIGDENAALVNVRNMAAMAVGLGDRLKETGTVFRTGTIRQSD
ncbi:hypothetical protein [Rhizobium sp. BK176]|uniref:hypothetical protein n=1 Tax=Rhizobium sp. BK176 TaxID=2587071 RepID=UPI0021687E12|nr:hypothetical protein [Rhizobium sp. BK176]MCS4089535.1 hypothetical protein [Rhizobium sp. BK176]